MERQPISLESEVTKKVIKPRRLPTVIARIGLSLMLATEVACNDQSTTPTEDTKTPTSTALSLETSASEYTELLGKYYPELLKSDLPVKGKVTVAKDSKSTTILNYTEYQLNVNNALATYDILERSASDSQAKIHYTLNETKRIFVLRPKHEVKSRTMLLVPSNAPTPSWLSGVKSVESESHGATIPVTGGALSFARVSTEDTDEIFLTSTQAATKIFATEACRQIVKIAVLDTNATEIKDLGETNLAQEIFCGSFGIAIAARSLGTTYDKYYTFAINHALAVKPDKEYPIIIFDQPTYFQFPITGGVLK